MEILEYRIDGSFVIMKNDMPYQVVPGMDEWDAVCTLAEVDAAEQAEKYAAAHVIPEPPVIEEPVIAE